jgi:hypothetical protein
MLQPYRKMGLLEGQTRTCRLISMVRIRIIALSFNDTG